MRSPPKTPGSRALDRHLSGSKLTRSRAILAKCCDCMGQYVDGKRDCSMPKCPLYPFMPYRNIES